MKQESLWNAFAAVWSVLTYIACWYWLAAHVEWSRKCSAEPALNYPHFTASCREMLALKEAAVAPAVVAAVLLVLVLIRTSRFASTSKVGGFGTSPLVAIGAALCLWGTFFGSMWLIYWRDSRRTCADAEATIFHAPYCDDLARALWEFGWASFVPLGLGIVLIAIYGLRCRVALKLS